VGEYWSGPDDIGGWPDGVARLTDGQIAALKQRHSKGLDAPRWLWSGVLDLAALHEAAYLEHCRQYALGNIPGK
jgi:uncharacterized protein (DUF2252 family)